MHPSQRVSQLGKLEAVGATTDQICHPGERVRLPKRSSTLLSCPGAISSLTPCPRSYQSPCSSHPSSLLPAQAEQPPKPLSAQEHSSQLVLIQALKPPPRSFLAFTPLVAASALPIAGVSGRQQAGLCLTEPVTRLLMTFAC